MRVNRRAPCSVQSMLSPRLWLSLRLTAGLLGHRARRYTSTQHGAMRLTVAPAMLFGVAFAAIFRPSNLRRNFTMKYDAGKTILLSTFKKFIFHDQFTVDTAVDDEGRVFVTKIWCKLCKAHEPVVKLGKPKGSAGDTALRFCVGLTQNISKHHLLRHLESAGHKKAKEASSTFEVDAPATETFGARATQPTINSLLDKASHEVYKKLFQTAYNLVNERLPYSKFQVLIKCIKESGVKLIEGKDDGRVAREYTSEIANAIREKVAVLLCSNTAFGVLTDGSEPKKTGSEKELIYVRTTKQGLPVYYCIGLEDVNDHGGANAQGLKSCIDKTFADLGIGDNEYLKCMVSATADGASVNTGVHSGLLTRLKTERTWVLTIHCVNHRAELAMKDAILSNDKMKSVDDFIQGIWHLHKKSGKLKRMYKNACISFGIDPYTIPRTHGTRFTAHRLRGIRTIIHGWVPLATSLREALEHKIKMMPGTQGKVSGFLKKLHSFAFLKDAHMFKDLLQEPARISLCFEQQHVLAWGVSPVVEKAKVNLDELLERTEDFGSAGSYELQSEDQDSSTGHSISVQIHKKGHMRKKAENRQTVDLSLSDITHTSEHFINVNSVKRSVIPRMINQLDTRFESFSLPIYTIMGKIMDPCDWVTADKKYGEQDIQGIAAHFEVPLSNKGFVLATALREWKELKYLRDRKYLGVQSLPFWQNILMYRKQEFPNMCLIADICLTISPSNSTTERGFSLLLTILSDRRLSLKHENVRDQLIIAANHLVWTPEEKGEIIDQAVRKYLEKKRKKKLNDDTKPRRRPKRRRLHILDADKDSRASVETVSDSDSDSQSDAISTDSENCQALDISSEEETAAPLLSENESEDSDFWGFAPEDLF